LQDGAKASKDPSPEGLLGSILDAGVCWSILLSILRSRATAEDGRQGYGETGWSDGVME